MAVRVCGACYRGTRAALPPVAAERHARRDGPGLLARSAPREGAIFGAVSRPLPGVSTRGREGVADRDGLVATDEGGLRGLGLAGELEGRESWHQLSEQRSE